METIVFNSIQVINYWFIQHRALRPLYQQAQTSSPYIRGISDQDITIASVRHACCGRIAGEAMARRRYGIYSSLGCWIALSDQHSSLLAQLTSV